jgi:hypothetical protein
MGIHVFGGEKNKINGLKLGLIGPKWVTKELVLFIYLFIYLVFLSGPDSWNWNQTRGFFS